MLLSIALAREVIQNWKVFDAGHGIAQEDLSLLRSVFSFFIFTEIKSIIVLGYLIISCYIVYIIISKVYIIVRLVDIQFLEKRDEIKVGRFLVRKMTFICCRSAKSPPRRPRKKLQCGAKSVRSNSNIVRVSLGILTDDRRDDLVPSLFEGISWRGERTRGARKKRRFEALPEEMGWGEKSIRSFPRMLER